MTHLFSKNKIIHSSLYKVFKTFNVYHLFQLICLQFQAPKTKQEKCKHKKETNGSSLAIWSAIAMEKNMMCYNVVVC